MLAADLPVYRCAYEMTLSIFRSLHEFPREYRYTIGQRIQDTCLTIIDLLARRVIYADDESHEGFVSMLGMVRHHDTRRLVKRYV